MCAAGRRHRREAGRHGHPASKYCGDIGGRLEIRTGADGGQTGMCHLPDNRVMEEWALFRSAHPPS
ncbi:MULTISPECIES: DUF333 domain-containing protein [unclassified Brevundimonas]|uniref:putative hemolysin n=1 Tax=unclassified Brevundimonas TaxID=2622653 RepID=UPI000E908116|nr:DUF333 domain-containing protein [Brevundimonas sp.]